MKFAASALIIAVSLVSGSPTGDSTDHNPLCPKRPVCSFDNKNYEGPCEALKDGKFFFTTGRCSEVDDCKCSLEFNPICVDSKTYSNPCVAQCFGYSDESKYQKGNCDVPEQDEGCKCSLEFAPVCADGKVYGNKCQAECEGIKDYQQGRCPEDVPADKCQCTKEFDPVCANGKTYPNACQADCEDIKDYEKGACAVKPPKLCDCTKEYVPVCVATETFANECEAKCKGFNVFVDGECKSGGDSPIASGAAEHMKSLLSHAIFTFGILAVA
eukprot:Partr_v1_DN27793_c1_g1_i1_m67499 putative Kazal-type serine protease inhibitor domain